MQARINDIGQHDVNVPRNVVERVRRLLAGVVLRPCPFCGGINPAIRNTHTPSFMVECECGAEVHAGTGRSFPVAIEAAVKAWNERA